MSITSDFPSATTALSSAISDAVPDDDVVCDALGRIAAQKALTRRTLLVLRRTLNHPAVGIAHRRMAAIQLRRNRDHLAPGSWVEHTPTAVAVTPAAFEALWAVEADVDPTPNPFNRNQLIRRKQATYHATPGGAYTFGAQTMQELPPSVGELELVQAVVRDVQERAGPRADRYSRLHINWYPDGRAGVAAHADDETDEPIYSYTFLSDGRTPREFVLLLPDKKTVVRRIKLGQGDVLVMGGALQRTHTHALRPTAAKRFATLRRINITVRALPSVE